MISHDEITRLTASERLALIGDLWDSLNNEETPLPVSQRQELQRRLTSFEADREHAISWDQLKFELTKRTS